MAEHYMTTHSAVIHHCERVEAQLKMYDCTDIRWIASQSAIEWAFHTPVQWRYPDRLALVNAIRSIPHVVINTQTLVNRSELP